MTQPDYYPADWPQLAAEIKAANAWRCQMCGAECRQQPSDRSKPVLTVAHVDQNYEGEAIQVAPLCVACHLRLDAPFGWQARRRHDRYRQRQAGQLTFLFGGAS